MYIFFASVIPFIGIFPTGIQKCTMMYTFLGSDIC